MAEIFTSSYDQRTERTLKSRRVEHSESLLQIFITMPPEKVPLEEISCSMALMKAENPLHEGTSGSKPDKHDQHGEQSRHLQRT